MQNNVEEMTDCLKRVAEMMNVKVNENQYFLFERFYDFLFEYNKKVNLTRIIEPVDVATKHFGDSLLVLSAKDFSQRCAVIDVGTGAGFPGIPIAIMRPDLQITLADSLRKRTAFLSEAIQRLDLKNVKVVWARAEELGQNPLYREKFDVVLARAVAPLNVLAELCLPLLKKQGVFLAMKGPKACDELLLSQGAIKKLGGFVLSIEATPLPLAEDVRTLIRIGKNRATPAIYPRKAGIPERQPLA